MEEYYEAVIKYKSRANRKYEINVVEAYFKVLRKISSILAAPKYQQDHKINQEYRQDIQNMRRALIKKEEEIEQKKSLLKELSERMETIFSNDSVIVIEHMREHYGQYELPEIKK